MSGLTLHRVLEITGETEFINSRGKRKFFYEMEMTLQFEGEMDMDDIEETDEKEVKLTDLCNDDCDPEVATDELNLSGSEMEQLVSAIRASLEKFRLLSIGQ